MPNKNFDMSDKKFKPLRAFTMHGATLKCLTGNQATGDCPFCGKEDHFFINWENLLWDCKACGEKGNFKTFLTKVNERNKKQLSVQLVRALAEERKLPDKAFAWVELGYHEGQYTIAVRDCNKGLIDLRMYRPGSRAMSTAGVKMGMFGLGEMLKAKAGTVYVCEGEWDTIAMQWLLEEAGKPGRAVCSPGANTFKPEWSDYFSGKDVKVCFDNDKAGMEGELVVLDRLAKKTKSLRFLHWPQGFPNGYDLRDCISKYAVARSVPKKTYRRLESYMRDRPRLELSSFQEESLAGAKTPEIDPSVTIEDVFRMYDEYLHEPNRMGIEVCMIASLASVFDTDPVWLFLVAPPSSGKTAIISGFRYLSQPHDTMALFLSHITTHSLVSGMETKRGDPSVFGQLNGNKMAFFIKDFTTVVSMRDTDKEDIYAQLRDAYDGYTIKSFGNGVKREYNSLKFSLVAGVTELIYDESVNFQALGERFGKINIGRGNDIEFSRRAISKSMLTRDGFKEMEDKCARTVYSCVKNLARRAEEAGYKLPPVSKELEKAIIGISLYVSSMRGCVSRDRYKRELIKSAPYTETGIRFAKMLAAVAAVRAFMYGRDVAGLEDLPLLRKIALDTVNQRDEEIIRSVYYLNKDKHANPFKKNILEESRYTAYTVRCVLEDLCMLNVIQRYRVGRKHFYRLSEQMLGIVKEAKLYDDEETKNRKNPDVRLKRSKTEEGRHSRLVLRKNG